MLVPKVMPDGRKRKAMRNLLIPQSQAYIRPQLDFKTSTSIWQIDEIIKKRNNDWRALTNEDGHTGERATLRKDGVFTGTHSIFPIPLVEYVLVRYGVQGGKLLDAFAGGPPRAIGTALMGMEYHGVDVRQQQIDENLATLDKLALENIYYYLNDARTLDFGVQDFDLALTCPPYYDLEVYSNQQDDISAFPTYGAFNFAMSCCAEAHRPLMKPGSFVCIVVGNFRDKEGAMIDFRGDTVSNFREAGFVFWEDVVLSRNFGSAAQRANNAWKGKKLVRRHEHLLVFKTPDTE